MRLRAGFCVVHEQASWLTARCIPCQAQLGERTCQRMTVQAKCFCLEYDVSISPAKREK